MKQPRDRFMDEGFIVDGKKILPSSSCETIQVHVHDLPLWISNGALENTLQQYGTVVGPVRYGKVFRARGGHVLSGVRFVTFKLRSRATHIPSLVNTAAGTRFRVMYSGQPRTCWRCNSPGHLLSECKVSKSKRTSTALGEHASWADTCTRNSAEDVADQSHQYEASSSAICAGAHMDVVPTGADAKTPLTPFASNRDGVDSQKKHMTVTPGNPDEPSSVSSLQVELSGSDDSSGEDDSDDARSDDESATDGNGATLSDHENSEDDPGTDGYATAGVAVSDNENDAVNLPDSNRAATDTLPSNSQRAESLVSDLGQSIVASSSGESPDDASGTLFTLVGSKRRKRRKRSAKSSPAKPGENGSPPAKAGKPSK